jgi:hypothetical protein
MTEITLPDAAQYVFGVYIGPASNPLVVTDAFALDFHSDWADRLEADRYSGGVRLHMGFGPYLDHNLTIVFWNTIKHVDERGEIAQGFGEMTVRIESEDA